MGALSCCEEKDEARPNIQQDKTIKAIRNSSASKAQRKSVKPPSLQIREAQQINRLNESCSLFKSTHSPTNKGRGPEDYQHLKYLGKGAFGCVVLVQEKATNKRYAMKIIEKAKIKQFNLMQCDLIKHIQHKDFLVPIKETFQTQSKIYILMQFLPMGDLYYYFTKKEKPFTEEETVNIAAEIVVSLDILHKQGIVYRQLKPENVLVTEEGHLKLTDYGLSKVLSEESGLVSTYIGTLDYTAPEAYSGNFGQKADIWSLGILIHELLLKDNLFTIPLDQQEKIMHGGQFPIERDAIVDRINSNIGNMSIQARNILLKMLEIDPESRISLEEIKEHDFFKAVDWDKVEKRENDPPLKEIKKQKDIIKFRDPAAEPYNRKQYCKKKKTHPESFEPHLFEFRSSS